MNRRDFVRVIGAAGAITGSARGAGETIGVVGGSNTAPSVRWALGELEAALTARGVTVRRFDRLPDAGPFCIQVGNLKTVDVLELADRAQNSADPVASLKSFNYINEVPATKVRSIARLFTSEVHDKPWFNDREMWPAYLTMLATHRFNRFQLAFGIGYDFLQDVTDAYFLFTYPFLFAVPGYKVRVPQLADAERDRNFEILKFISEQTVARGMEFQIGLWMHGYKWLNSPNPNYTIEGLNAENHAAYCRDALRQLLKACPAISGVTFRIHGESGVEEGNFDFWKTIFDGVASCGRRVEIDMHAKGMNQGMLDTAVATGMPVKVSPKYWAEHMGMPYHQADIREQERPKPGKEGSALMKYSAGARSFLRYGYGDLLREDRKWGVLTRVWPGTQRLLIWGDPVTAAAHARAFSFCGSDGVEFCEPLSFKGRRGSGIAGDRCGYADASLRTRWDWQKYEYTYRVWGRLLYNPNADADQWQRALRKDFANGAGAVESALANAGRILPIVTTAHAPSAGNNNYWPEVYTNQSIVTVAKDEPYTDTFAPKVFGNTGALDPQLFSRINDHADDLLAGRRSEKYSPVEVAQWLEDYADAAASHLAKVTDRGGAEFRRVATDVQIQYQLGRFFGAKFRAGVLYRIHEQTGDLKALREAIAQYEKARKTWAEIAQGPGKAYVSDITVGEHRWLRGHWMDRLPAIDGDIESMRGRLVSGQEGESEVRVKAAIREALGRPRRAALECSHRAVTSFRGGQGLKIELDGVARAKLLYRHVDQAERWESVTMAGSEQRLIATIPPEYTNSAFALQYYFVVDGTGLFPGFSKELNNQPYYLVRRG